jgi:hypothetical protein
VREGCGISGESLELAVAVVEDPAAVTFAIDVLDRSRDLPSLKSSSTMGPANRDGLNRRGMARVIG